MSKIGKQPIEIPDGVQIDIDGSTVRVKGPKGELSREFLPCVEFEIRDKEVIVKPKNDELSTFKFWGLSRALLFNMVKGVSEGFKKELEFSGVGYRASVQGDTLELSLGFSHPVKVKAPEGITFEAGKSSIVVEGIDKQKVGEIAAQIRALRKAEPYKGKGIKYKDEQIRRKVGKKAVGTA